MAKAHTARKTGKGKYSKEAADRVVDFIRNLKHTKGEYYGKPFDLQPWQEDGIIRPVFGTLRDNGARQYRTAYIEMPKKNGKTELAGAIALYMLLGDGEKTGEGYIASGDLAQGGIVFDVAKIMIQQDKTLSRMTKVLGASKRIAYYRNNSFLQVLAKVPDTKEGLNPSFVLFDEFWVYSNRDMYDTLTMGTGTRKNPLTWITTIAGHDRSSVCYDVHKYAKRAMKNKKFDPSFFGFVLGADNNDDWKSRKTWFKVNPQLGKTLREDDFRSQVRKAEESPAFLSVFLRKRLGVWVEVTDTPWIHPDAWDNCCNEDVLLQNYHGCRIWVALDAASVNDLASVAIVIEPEDGKRPRVFVKSWCPSEGIVKRSVKMNIPFDSWARDGYIDATQGVRIRHSQIKRFILSLKRVFKVQAVACDPWNIEQMMQELSAAGLEVLQFNQRFKDLSPGVKTLLGKVLDCEIELGTNPVLTWAATNAVLDEDAHENVKFNKRKSKDKIDPLVALVMALELYRRDTEKIDIDKSVYSREGRGIIGI